MPIATSCQKAWTLAMMNPFLKTAGIKVPTSEPTIVPMPPKRLVPPMTTADMAGRVSRGGAPPEGGFKPGQDINPAKPAQKPQEISRADLGLDRRRHVGNVGASRKDLRRPEEYP